MPGEIIRNHDVYVNKQSPKNPAAAVSSVLKDQYVFCILFKNSVFYG